MAFRWYRSVYNAQNEVYVGKNSHFLTQVETGSAITWKYPSCILSGDSAIGEFYSVALTNNKQQADTGTKMIHIAPNTKSRIISKGISAGESDNSYRGLVKVGPNAAITQNYSQCDSLLVGKNSSANTFHILVQIVIRIEHEASTLVLLKNNYFIYYNVELQ